MHIHIIETKERCSFIVASVEYDAAPEQTVWVCWDEDGHVYNVSIGNGETRRDFWADTQIEAFRLAKSLLK